MPTVKKSTTAGFLFYPFLSVFVNILLAGVLSNVYKLNDESWRSVGITMSSMLASTSITIVTLTFSLTVLSIQIAAQTYSPRLLDDFLQDPISHIAVSVNLGAFAYAFFLQYWLEHEDTDVPILAIHMLSVHLILVLFMFVVFIHYFINGFRLESILHRATEASWTAAQKLEAMNADSIGEELPQVPMTAYKVLADHSGYLSQYRLPVVLEKATKLDLIIRYHPNIGEFIAEGSLLAYVWVANTKEDCKGDALDITSEAKKSMTLQARVLKLYRGSKSTSKNLAMNEEERVEEYLGKIIASGLEITTARSGELDVLLGVQQLTDVAVRALSAAVNDPMTAVQALDYLSTLFGRLASLELPIGCVRDKKGVLRCYSQRRSFVYLLSILDSIRFYGGADLQVLYRLIRFYGDLGATLKRAKKMDRISAVLAQIEQCMTVCRKNFEKSSMEMQSLQELYDYSMSLIASSDSPLLQSHEEIEKDLNELETTFSQPTSGFLNTLSPEVKEELTNPMVEQSSSKGEKVVGVAVELQEGR